MRRGLSTVTWASCWSRREPLKELVARRTVVGITPSGAMVFPAPVDYLSSTEQIASFAARKDLRAPTRGIWLTGTMSASAQRGLSELGWAVHDAPPLAGTR